MKQETTLKSSLLDLYGRLFCRKRLYGLHRALFHLSAPAHSIRSPAGHPLSRVSREGQPPVAERA